MSNPNNSWIYNYPLPPGYAPPPPPPPKGLLVPPKGKNRALALAMVCGMALVSLAASLLPFLNGPGVIDSLLANPLYIGLDALNLLLFLLVFLKFVLPGWEPHRKILGWLLGALLLCSLALSIYSVLQGLQIGFSAAGEAYGADSGLMEGMRIGGMVGGVIGALLGVAMSPFLYLFIGACNKKSMEKVAGVFAAVAVGGSIISVPITLLAGLLASDVMEMPATLWTTTLPGLVSSICAVILYFTWPVLERPVLEKPDPTSSGL